MLYSAHIESSGLSVGVPTGTVWQWCIFILSW